MLPFLLLALGGDDRISIPLGTYSLPELGHMLSTKSQTVDVTNSISDRGALIGLNDRSVSEALKIVCAGLDLQVSQARKGHLQLEPNTKIEARDRRWREALLTNLSRRAEAQTESAIKLADLGRDELIAKKQKLRSQYPLEGDVVSQALTLAAGEATVRAAAILASNSQFEMKNELIDDGDQIENFQVELPPDLAIALQQKMSTSGRITKPSIERRTLERDPGQLRLNTSLSASTADGNLIPLQNPFSPVTVGNRPIAIDGSRRLFHELICPYPDYQVPGIGSDATAWLLATENSTRQELSRAHLSDSFELSVNDPSVSALIQKWATDFHQEVVMELAPMAESLNFTPYSVLPAPPKLSVADLVLKDDSWCLDSSQSVLVVRNRMAFLDRQIPTPVGAIAHFARVSPGRSGIESNPYRFENDDTPLPLADDLLPLVRIREQPTDYRSWFDWTGYHGLTDGYLENGAILLWPGIPNRVLPQVRSASQGALSIPISDFSEASIDELVGSKVGSEAQPSDWNRIYKEVLKGRADIKWKRMSGQEVMVQLVLSNITDEMLQIGNASIFRIKSKRL